MILIILVVAHDSSSHGALYATGPSSVPDYVTREREESTSLFEMRTLLSSCLVSKPVAWHQSGSQGGRPDARSAIVEFAQRIGTPTAAATVKSRAWSCRIRPEEPQAGDKSSAGWDSNRTGLSRPWWVLRGACLLRLILACPVEKEKVKVARAWWGGNPNSVQNGERAPTPGPNRPRTGHRRHPARI